MRSSSSRKVLFKLNFFFGLLLFFAMCSSLSAGMAMAKRPRLTMQQLEDRYWQTPPVKDERNADAELDSAYKRPMQRGSPMTSNHIKNP
ncbi:Hypothetical predicted protein [Drosophila guanche]|uniref:Uncharacterized protein n=1 Tax=Drosophila guanche TaxID=7266 RepID=A0A3B0JSP9_DROGU|nr:Hypothetical predicted protein [Drosophila guanche]